MVVLSCSLGEREHRRERKSGSGGMVAARRRVPRVNLISGHLFFFFGNFTNRITGPFLAADTPLICATIGVKYNLGQTIECSG